MIIIGDSIIQKLPKNNKYTINSYPGITTDEYLKTYNDLQEDEDIIIYSLGTNDNLTDYEIIVNYSKLKQGLNKTYIIIPPSKTLDFLDYCEVELNDNIIMICTLLEFYETEEDDIHPSKNTIDRLYDDIISL